MQATTPHPYHRLRAVLDTSGAHAVPSLQLPCPCPPAAPTQPSLPIPQATSNDCHRTRVFWEVLRQCHFINSAVDTFTNKPPLKKKRLPPNTSLTNLKQNLAEKIQIPRQIQSQMGTRFQTHPNYTLFRFLLKFNL